MTTTRASLLALALLTALPAPAQDRAAAAQIPLTTLTLPGPREPVPDLVCPVPRPAGKPAPRPPAPPVPETRIPEEDEVREALADLGAQPGAAAAPGASAPAAPPSVSGPPAASAAAASAPGAATAGTAPAGWPRPSAAQPLRLAVWGDSHMAAGFFTEELLRLAGQADVLAQPRLVPAAFGHPGVRGLVRRACVSPEWTREPGHAMAAAAATALRQPGPGLVSLVATRPGATLALDLRDAAGRPRHHAVQLLLAPEATGATLGVTVDGLPERLLRLAPQDTAWALEVAAPDAPLAVLRLRVVEGPLRLQGLRVGSEGSAPGSPAAPAAPLEVDLFGYPGATASGWARAEREALGSWFGQRPYDVVMLAYGTNEAHDRRFQPEAYRDTLVRAVAAMRQVFPGARCVLVAPGDRGVRVSGRARAAPAKKGQASRPAAPSSRSARTPRAPRPSAAELLHYARLHEQVAAIQQEVAAQAGCASWSMQAAMGGTGTAYTWARATPALMAGDLLHFTAAGYRELARRFAADFGWSSP